MQPPRIDPEQLKHERHDVDLGTDEETNFGHAAGKNEPDATAEADVLDQKGAAPIPNAD